jgi:hypothetical protein
MHLMGSSERMVDTNWEILCLPAKKNLHDVRKKVDKEPSPRPPLSVHKRNDMRIWCTSFAACGLLLLIPAQIPPLPDGRETHWEMTEINEIGVRMVFDPATVADRLPDGLRFRTVKEMAPKDPQVQEYLATHPEQVGYAFGVLEIVRQRFVIDGREPNWPQDGAVGLWFATVASTGQVKEGDQGYTTLLLDLLVPDRDYVAYMRGKGHYADYGDARLKREESGMWHGTIQSTDLRVEGACTPAVEAFLKEGTESQALFQPRGEKHFLWLAWAGHEDHQCNGKWTISGSHPLSKAVTIGWSIYACCYRTQGGAYRVIPAN